MSSETAETKDGQGSTEDVTERLPAVEDNSDESQKRKEGSEELAKRLQKLALERQKVSYEYKNEVLGSRASLD